MKTGDVMTCAASWCNIWTSDVAVAEDSSVTKLN